MSVCSLVYRQLQPQPVENNIPGIKSISCISVLNVQHDMYHVRLNLQGKRWSWHIQVSALPAPASSSSRFSSLATSSPCIPYSKEVHQVLYLLDWFAISDQFCHELVMINPSLPRSYQVKKARNLFSSNVEIRRLPNHISVVTDH